MKAKIVFLALLVLCISWAFSSRIELFVNAQTISSTTDNQTFQETEDIPNFYEIRESFYKKIEPLRKKGGKIPGLKQFQRWEHFMEQRTYPSGDIINRGQLIWKALEYKWFKRGRV